ncbi:MAG: ATP-grasp domain-containing protein, partial [Gemmataceae bacterium]
LMKSVAFVTHRAMPEIDPDDRLAADVLRSGGVAVEAAVWDDPAVDWPRFDAVVIRSTWDYHLMADHYEAWLRRLESAGVRVWNPPDAILANLNKRYLLDLAGRGVEVVPTAFVPAGDGVSLGGLMRERGWAEAVVKPAVSAGARATWRTAGEDGARFAAQVLDEDTLVQEYVPEIEAGEWSLLFFGGAYSHAVRKRPGAGDFRVQQHLGGSTSAEVPGPALIAQARTVLHHVDHPLLYARLDGVERGGRFVLMELEINEPYLFLGYAAGAAARFAAAVASGVG